tara:strand:- start:1229 stop:1600 length:372 start_codon:yes stop_codon:yes gene_type:complete
MPANSPYSWETPEDFAMRQSGAGPMESMQGMINGRVQQPEQMVEERPADAGILPFLQEQGIDPNEALNDPRLLQNIARDLGMPPQQVRVNLLDELDAAGMGASESMGQQGPSYGPGMTGPQQM